MKRYPRRQAMPWEKKLADDLSVLGTAHRDRVFLRVMAVLVVTALLYVAGHVIAAVMR